MAEPFDVGAWMARIVPLYEDRYGTTDRDPAERMALRSGSETRYGESADPATDDPLELALIDAMWAEYMGAPSTRLTIPETFWPQARYLHLPGMARAVLRTLVALATPEQAPLPLEDAA